MKIYLAILFLGLLSACVGQKKAEGILIDNASELPSKYYLHNRTINCIQALEFMKNLIVPDSINTKLFYNRDKFYRLGNIMMSIKGERNARKIEDLHLFYIDLECLKGSDIRSVFGLMCTSNQAKIIMTELESERGLNGRYIFECIINNLNCFTLNVNQGKIENMSWCITVTNDNGKL